jgi:O-antigen/teichoic acid export membrane protein
LAHPGHIVISKKLVALNSASSVLARLINATVLLWMYQYLLRRISAEEFAVYPVVMAVMVFAPLFFSFFTGGISRYVVEAYAKGEFGQVTRIVSSIFPLLLAAAAVLLSAGMLLAANVEHVLNIAPSMVEAARIMLALLVVSAAAQMLGLAFTPGFHVRQRFVELNMLGIARDLLRIALLFLLLLGLGADVVWVVVATVVSELVYVPVMVMRSRRMVPELRFRWSHFDWKHARKLMSFGIWTTLGQLSHVMSTSAATILLNLFGTGVDVTAYHIGATFHRQLGSMISLAALPLQPAMTAMHSLAEKQRLKDTVLRGGRYGLWVSLAVAVPLAIYAKEFIALYLGEGHAQVAVVITLFMATFPFTQPTALLLMTAMATARLGPFFVGIFLFQLLITLLSLYLAAVHDVGAIGVTLALTVVTALSQLFYFGPLCLRLIEASFGLFVRRVLTPGFAPALAGAAVWVPLKYALMPDSWLSLFVCAAAGGMVYVATLLSFCLDEGERKDARNLLRVALPARAR